MSFDGTENSRGLLGLPSELIDRIIDLAMGPWDAFIRTGPTVAKEQVKPGLAAAFEQAMLGASLTHELLIPGTIVLHLHTVPTHGNALRQVCKKMYSHCVEWFKSRESYPSQIDFSGRTIFKDLEAFRLNQNLYYPRRMHRTWRVRFNEEAEDSRVEGSTRARPRKVSERHAEWLREATRIIEVCVDQKSKELAHFENFKQYLPNVEAVVIVSQLIEMPTEECHSQSDEWWLALIPRPPSLCFVMGVRTSTRSSVRCNTSDGTKSSSVVEPYPTSTVHVVTVDHAQQGPIAAEVAVSLNFGMDGSEQASGSQSLDVLSSWQLAQVRQLEESSRWESDRPRLILNEDVFGYSIGTQIHKGWLSAMTIACM